jgi:hypothetical protein
MKATVGDRIVIKGHTLHEHDIDCEVLDVPDPTGAPPYRVRWGTDGHESLFYPGTDAFVQHFVHDDERSPR